MEEVLKASERLLRPEGLKFRALSREESVELEPALVPIGDQLIGAIHNCDDETGDAHRFCTAIAEMEGQRGVELLYRLTASGFGTQAGAISSVITNEGELTADQYVVAAGSYSTLLLTPLGIRLPVRPAKGYSVTFERPTEDTLTIPVVDDDMHAVVVPVGNAIRVAGTAEFTGFDLTLRSERVSNLVNLAQRILPSAGLDSTTARAWCGLRPLSPDGVPILGRTRIRNLWVSTGHGPLGWTMAAGSGELLADLISGESPKVDPAPYDPNRFGTPW